MNDEKQYIIESYERAGKRGGGTMVLVRSDYAHSIVRLSPTTPISRDWHTEEGRAKLGALELTIIRTRPHRLPRGFSCVLVVAVYISEFTASRHRSSIG